MPATFRKIEHTLEEIYAKHQRERDQARLDWHRRKIDPAFRVKYARLYARACWTWASLKEVKRDLEAKMIGWLDVVQNPGPLVTGDTWTQASIRVEEARAELAEVKGAFRRMAAQIKEATEHFITLSAWLERHPDVPDYKRREREVYAAYEVVARLTGWLSDTMEDRIRLFKLAELNGFPEYAPLKIKGGMASWQIFLLSAETTAEQLAECREAWA